MISDTNTYGLYMQKVFEPKEKFLGEFAGVENQDGLHFVIAHHEGGFLPKAGFQLTINLINENDA